MRVANRMAYGAAVSLTALFGLALLLVLRLAVIDAENTIAWIIAVLIAVVGSGIIWFLASICRRLQASLSDAQESTMEVARRRRRRLIRLLICTSLTVAFGAWYSERASHSDYPVPPLARSAAVTGKLEPPSGRARNRSIRIKVGDQSIALACLPNSRYPSDCLDRQMHKDLGGTLVTARYYEFSNAFRHAWILVQLNAQGREVVRYTDQARELTAARLRDQQRTWQRTIPDSILIGYLVWLLVEAQAAFDQMRSRRVAAKRKNSELSRENA